MSVFEALTLMITFAILVVKIFAETHRKKRPALKSKLLFSFLPILQDTIINAMLEKNRIGF